MSLTLTELITQGRALAAAATKRPWLKHGGPIVSGYTGDNLLLVEPRDGWMSEVSGEQDRANEKLVLAACNQYTTLLDVIEIQHNYIKDAAVPSGEYGSVMVARVNSAKECLTKVTELLARQAGEK